MLAGFIEKRVREEGDPPRVVVIDDCATLRRTVVGALKRGGMHVEAAGCGEEGIDMAQRGAPDLILTDLSMPGLDGFGILSILRADPRTAMTPIVVMTGLDDRASVRRAMSLGADDYLTKPFTAKEVLDTVQARLQRYSRITESYASKLAQTRAQLLEATHRDPETALGNRLAFRGRLAAKSDVPLAVLIVELDRFERLHSALHGTRPEMMDIAIREISARLREVCGGTSQLYRLDTSRFAVLQPKSDRQTALELAEALLLAMRQPLGGPDLELRMTASIGVGIGQAVRPLPLSTLAAHAEVAAHHARETGGNHAVVYDAEAHDRAYNRVRLESSMYRALERRQFELHYQPQVDGATGRLIGVEALIRWNHPELGQVSPFHFIPIAEETGLIVPIGEWVLEEACRQLAEWRSIPELSGLRMAVNLSALQLAEPNLADTVLRIVNENGLDPRQLNLELTESMMIGAGEAAARSLGELCKAGVGISIDDFGTGYSSLGNLRAFPISEVKVDRSFIRRVPADRESSLIVSAVIEMAHQLGLRVVAEGVEELEQLEFLRERKCDEIQGYYYSKPLPPLDLCEWAREHRAAA